MTHLRRHDVWVDSGKHVEGEGSGLASPGLTLADEISGAGLSAPDHAGCKSVARTG